MLFGGWPCRLLYSITLDLLFASPAFCRSCTGDVPNANSSEMFRSEIDPPATCGLTIFHARHKLKEGEADMSSRNALHTPLHQVFGGVLVALENRLRV